MSKDFRGTIRLKWRMVMMYQSKKILTKLNLSGSFK